MAPIRRIVSHLVQFLLPVVVIIFRDPEEILKEPLVFRFLESLIAFPPMRFHELFEFIIARPLFEVTINGLKPLQIVTK